MKTAIIYIQKAADVVKLSERLREIIWTLIRSVKVDLVIDEGHAAALAN